MTVKKIFVILYILSLFTLTGCESTKTLNYNPEIIVYGPVLKISLIQTAHEIYTTNIENSSDNSNLENMYIEDSKESKKHYKWLNKAYKSMDDDMKNKLKNIFDSNSSWNYLNAVIDLEDSSSINNIIDTLNYILLNKSQILI